MLDVTVIFSIYEKTNLSKFKLALNSILNQTLLPKYIIIVCDGCSFDMFESCLDEHLSSLVKINIYEYKENLGPSYARDFAIKRANTKYIAIMDSDDISALDRLEIQYNFMEKNNNISVVGGYISEEKDGNFISIRKVPLHHKDISKTIKYKSPINNVTAFMRRKDYIYVGGYPSIRSSEDYCLWSRFLIHGKKMANIENILVYVEFDEDTLIRRSGLLHFKNDLFTQKTLYKSGIINIFTFNKNIFKYFIFRLMNIKIKKFIYTYVLRK